MAKLPNNIEGEVWRDVPGCEGELQASSLGRLRRLRVYSSFRVPDFPYEKASIWCDGRRKQVTIHRMVCLAFHGEPPLPNLHAAHLNGDALDNRPDNLGWATARENNGHKVRHGTHNRGERHNKVRITEDDVRRIRVEPLTRVQKDEIAKELGITRGHINDIIKRRCWRHLP